MRLMKLSEYRMLFFTPKSRPSLSTLRRRNLHKQLTGGVIHDGHHYIDLDVLERETNLRQNLAAQQQELESNPLLAGLV